MVARINLPGSRHHTWFRGTKAECWEWIEKKIEEKQNECGGNWIGACGPAAFGGGIITEKEAANCRYLDGTKCYPREKD